VIKDRREVFVEAVVHLTRDSFQKKRISVSVWFPPAVQRLSLINPVIDLCPAFFQNRVERISRNRLEYPTVNRRMERHSAVAFFALLNRDDQASIFGGMRRDYHVGCFTRVSERIGPSWGALTWETAARSKEVAASAGPCSERFRFRLLAISERCTTKVSVT
jgi:hypothetical protein